MKRDYKLYLHDIKNAVISIFEFTDGMTFEDFDKDDKTHNKCKSQNTMEYHGKNAG